MPPDRIEQDPAQNIRITAGGHVFGAETNPAAPRTVAAFAKLLP